MLLKIFVEGRLRYERPYSHGQACAVARALSINLPEMGRHGGRAAALVSDGNVDWLMCRVDREGRMTSYDAG